MNKSKLQELKYYKIAYEVAKGKHKRLSEQACNLSQQLKEIPVKTGSHKNYIEWQLIELSEAYDYMLKAKKEYDEKLANVVNIVNQINDKRLKLILELRYIDCLEWQDIAERMNLSLSYVYTLHGWALVDFIKVQEKKEG